MNRKRIVFLLPILFFLWCSQATSKVGKSLQPPTPLQDQIIHNKGNIATTVQNWGWIGGQSHLGKPSGEWPKGSGHHYLAEIKYWMGAVKPGRDTVVANTDDDFMPLPSMVNGEESYRIHLSTDPTSYNYDLADTVGLGIGKPAYGWRVWDSQSEQWVYNQVWTLSSGMVEAGPISLQESHYRFYDANSGVAALGLELTQTIYQWNYIYNEDYLFVVLEIKNVSDNNYPDFAFGLYCDFDVGGIVPGTFENGRLGDLVAFDSSMNLAWTYDEDGYDQGWGPLVKTGLMGTKYIETPDNIGMTAFRTGRWEDLPDNDPKKYEFIDSQQFDQSLPPTDQYYVQCTRGINLSAGKTVRVVFALVAGHDEQELKNNASMAQVVYDNYFIGPEPPRPAKLVGTPGYQKVKLVWDNSSESSVDPLSGETDFKGYKIYRSTDMGQTWGDLVRNPDGSLGPDYVPIAMYQKEHPNDILPHTYTDENLVNGVEYWYSVVSFDEGDTSVPIEPLQTAYGRPGEDVNCVFAYPRTDPAGYYPASATVEHQYLGNEEPSDGTVTPVVFDQAALTGHEYKVAFTEDPLATYWHVVDQTIGDTVLKDQTVQSGNPQDYPVIDGMQVIVANGEREPSSYGQTQFATAEAATLHMHHFLGSMGELFGFPLGADMHFRSTYELRFTQPGSQAYSFLDDVTPVWVPFEVWNTTTGEQVLVEVYDQAGNGIWDPDHMDYLDIVNIAYDGQPHPEAFPYYHVWFFAFAPTDTEYAAGDVYQITGAKLNGPDDEFLYTAGGIDARRADEELSEIRVVPNPYIAHALWETTEGIRKVQFTNLPDLCTIRVYTLAGDLVRVIEHDNGTGTEDWDLLNKHQQGIVPGVYFYHVDSKYGEKLGKFAVIK
ncbi:MAG: hypothetical protein GTO24_23280 [candidate division Zixibacteria bacterium]|nr:hypothetical protein [candidate division Zixibacteria bacterium]